MPTRSDAYDKKLASCSVPPPIRKLGAKKFSFTFAELGDPYPFKDPETDGQSQSSMDCGSSHLSEESFDRQYQVYKSYSDSDDLDNLVLYNTVGRFSAGTREARPSANRLSDSSRRSRVVSRQDEGSPVGLSCGQSVGRGRDYSHPCDKKQSDCCYGDDGTARNKSLEEEAQRPEVMALINKYKPFSYSDGSLKKGHNGVVITPGSKGQGHDCTTAAAAAIGHGSSGSQQRRSAEKQHGNSVGWVLSKKPDITKSDKRQAAKQLFSKYDSNSGSLDSSRRNKSLGHHATSLDMRKYETNVEHRQQGQSQGVGKNHQDSNVSSSSDTSFQKRSNYAGDYKAKPTSVQPLAADDHPRLGERQLLRHRVSEDEWNTNQMCQSSPRSMDDFSITAPSDSSDRSSRIDPQVYQSYAAGLLHSSYRSNKFMRLQNYYSLLERIAAIEGKTLAKNALSGKGRFNLVNLRSTSLGSLAPQSKADNILLSKYDVNNIWELKEMYADLEEAQDDEQFLFDAGRVEEFQWNPWEDWGIQNKKLSTQQLQFMFEKGLNQNTQASLRKLYRGTDVEFRREMSFRKLYEKYKHLDEETRKQKIMDEWGWRKHRSRRSSDSSSMFSCGSSMTGTYLELMEKAAEKARQRAIYGYHIPEEYNSYEKHVLRMKKLTRSCPDINRLLKDKGRRSAVRGSSKLSRDISPQKEEGHPSSGPMLRSWSEHRLSPKTGKTEREKDDLDCMTNTAQSSTNMGELLRQELGEVSSLAVDGQKQARKWNETTPPWKSHKSGNKRAVGSSENCVDGRQTDQLSQRSAEKGDSGLNMSWDDSFESEEPLPSHKRRTRTRSQGKSSWRSEVRGVVGIVKKNEDEVKCVEPVRVPPRTESLEQKLENFRQKHGWRKDSKPDPGTVSRALNVFQAMEEEQIVPQHQEPLVGNGNPSLARRRREAENASLHVRNLVSAVNEEQIKQQHQEPLIGDGNPSLTNRRKEAENESLHGNNGFSAVDEDVILPQHQEPLIGEGNPSLPRRRREAEIEFWKEKHQMSTSGDEDFTSTYQFQRSKSLSAKHERGLQKHSTSPSLRTHHLQSYKSESELFGKYGRKSDAFLQAKNRFEEMALENELASYPKTGLPSKSQKTALGRYEARIRGRSEMRESPAQGRLHKDMKSKSIEYDRFQEELRKHSRNTDELSTASWKSKEASLEQHIRSRVDMTQRSSTDPSEQFSDIHKGRDSPDWDEPESPSDGRISRLEKREDDVSSCDYNDGDLTDVKRPFESRYGIREHSSNMTAAGNNKELILVRYPQHKEQTISSQNSTGMYETDIDTSAVQPFTRQLGGESPQCRYGNHHAQRTHSETESLEKQRLGERTKMAIISPNTFSEDKPVVHVEPTNNTRQSPVGDDVHFGMTPSQRSYSASVLTTDSMMTDPNYGDLSKWSRLNVTEGLERGEDGSGQLQKWGATCLNIATMSSNETFIIKDSDPEMSPGECSRSFSGRLPSQCEDERQSVFHDVSQETERRTLPTQDSNQESSPERHRGKDKHENSVKPVGIPFRRKAENAKTSNLNEEPMCYTWKREYDVPPNVDIDEVRKGGIKKDAAIYHSLGVIRNFTKEAGPQDFYNDLERLGKEWQRDADKKQTRHSTMPFFNQYRRPEGIGAGSRPLPEYRPPPCYVHPWLEQEPDYEPPHQSTRRHFSNIPRQPYYCMPYPSHSNIVPNQQQDDERSLAQSKSCPEIVPNNREGYISSEVHRAFPLAEPHFQSSHQVSHLPLASSHGMQNQTEKHHGDVIPTNQSEHAQTTTQSNVPRQRHSVSGTGHSPTGSWDNRRRRDEEAARRKQEMKRITAQEKLKRMEEERKANEARRHNDFLTPSQKSPIPLNRYDDVPDISDLQRPKKKVGTQYRGKARALYNFKAQNPKELSFKKNDIIYLLRQIDKNWYEGEHHGLVGLFPVNYVEVLMSLDEARQAAILREGHAKAKYNFTAQSAMEVSFKKGDTVSLIRRIDNNWFEGRVDGRHGIFPVSYVEVLREPDTPLPTPMSSYAPTPATGSPGQLSPVSTISNGPAPTIPSAPISPRSSVDNFDFGQPFSYSQYPSSSASLQRPSRRDQSYTDYGLDQLNPMRPASALGGLSDGYGTVPRDRYNQMNRPNSAVPFSDYLKNSARDSGFYSSEESRYSRQKHREEELMRSLSNPYEGRQPSTGSQSRDSFSRGEELRYPPYQALYSYRPQNPDELELREGDIVYVMEKCDDDWYVGTSQRTKEFGTFPGNYVRQL